MSLEINEKSIILLLDFCFESCQISFNNLKNFISEKAKLLKTESNFDPRRNEIISSLLEQAKHYEISKIQNEMKPIRGLVDGVFDMAHFGHFNGLRQARKLCDHLIAAVIDSESTANAKGYLHKC